MHDYLRASDLSIYHTFYIILQQIPDCQFVES